MSSELESKMKSPKSVDVVADRVETVPYTIAEFAHVFGSTRDALERRIADRGVKTVMVECSRRIPFSEVRRIVEGPLRFRHPTWLRFVRLLRNRTLLRVEIDLNGFAVVSQSRHVSSFLRISLRR
jgi:hypothetical protein